MGKMREILDEYLDPFRRTDQEAADTSYNDLK